APQHVVAEEQAVLLVPQPLEQRGGQLLCAHQVVGRVGADAAGDAGQRVLGGDQQGVEAGVLHGEAVRDPAAGRAVEVSLVAVVGRQPHVAAVVEVGGAVGGNAVVQVGAAEGARGGGLDAGERRVPARAVVHARLP